MYQSRRVFDWNDQKTFARISHDYNPIHMSEAAARRTQAGAPIVHGVHSLIWILDCFAQSSVCTSTVKSLRVKFLRPIYVGEEVNSEISQMTTMTYRMVITAGSEQLVTVAIGTENTKYAGTPTTALSDWTITSPPCLPNDPSLDEIEKMSGCLSFGSMISPLDALFPAAVRMFGIQTIAALACSSCLVGMVVPGLHSLFLGLQVFFADDDVAPPAAIKFAVESVVRRFGSVRIGIRAQSLYGFLEAISRAKPVSQPDISRVNGLVSRDEFRDTSALIVGGSRGLGELTGKLIAVGGGEVVITYSTGKSDAVRVATEIQEAGFRCRAACYDVKHSALEQLMAFGPLPTQVYYFATPVIYRRKTGIFDCRRLSEFNNFYVAAFFDLVRACIQLRPGVGLKVFYPSSEFIDVRPAGMTEYAMSKAAAEVLCDDISRFVPGVQILRRRLPRLRTDQTSSLIQMEGADAIEVVLAVVRDMHGLNRKRG